MGGAGTGHQQRLLLCVSGMLLPVSVCVCAVLSDCACAGGACVWCCPMLTCVLARVSLFSHVCCCFLPCWYSVGGSWVVGVSGVAPCEGVYIMFDGCTHVLRTQEGRGVKRAGMAAPPAPGCTAGRLPSQTPTQHSPTKRSTPQHPHLPPA